MRIPSRRNDAPITDLIFGHLTGVAGCMIVLARLRHFDGPFFCGVVYPVFIFAGLTYASIVVRHPTKNVSEKMSGLLSGVVSSAMMFLILESVHWR